MGERDTLFDLGDFPQSMDSFHQAYIPSNAVLRRALAPLRRLQIDRILPQHGAVIEGDAVAVAIEHLAGLACCVDLLPAIDEDGHEQG